MKPGPERVVLWSLLAAGGGLLLFLIALVTMPAPAVRAWLLSALFFLGLSVGALILLMIHNLTGGRWGDVVRPQLVAMAGILPWGALAMTLPVARSGDILAWTAAAPATLPHSVRAKLAWFDPALLAARTGIILAVWLILAWAITTRPTCSPTARTWSIVGLVVVMVTTLLFATDWMMAPEPEFYSTIYPVLESSGEVVGAFAGAIGIAAIVSRRLQATASDRGRTISEDLANLLFGFVLLWVYLAFMQWLIVWSGNLPEEIGWYLRRGHGIWLVVLLLLVLFHFIVPVGALLSRRLKRSRPLLAALAALLVAGHFLDVIWRIAPPLITTLADTGIGLAAFVAVGGIWVAGAVWLRAGRPAIPLRRGADA